ncbi:MAG: class I SAM-dependent methyltransferase [Chitinophagales bacterium]
MQAKKQWFENWFDTKYYHILYQHRNDDEAHFFMNNLVDYLKIPENSEILDLACGKGRHSVFLNQKALDITGVDLSAQSIAHAKQFENKSLHFDVHDMREVYPKKFDYVFNLFTSFGYFEDDAENLKTIQAMKAMLKQRGVLVIDFLNATKVINNLVLSEKKELNGIYFSINREVENGFIVKNIQFEDEGEFYHFQERVKALNLNDFKVFFEKAGLRLKETFGNFALEAYNKESSDRLIMILETV